MNRNLALRVFLLLLVRPCFSQDLTFTRQIIDTLCSPSMAGRGYVNKGEYKAALYIRDRFEEFGLRPVGKNYFQCFNMSINTFPKKIFLQINQKTLHPGIDFLVEPSSGKGKGKYGVFRVASTSIRGKKDLLKRKFLLVDKSEVSSKDEQAAMDLWMSRPAGAKGVIMIEDNKLTWSVARKQNKHPVVRVLRTSLPEKPGEISIRIDSKLRKKYHTQNVIGLIPGTEKPDSFIVFTAHYDHLGMMGKETIFPGANDNASGVSFLLNLAKHYSEKPSPYSMVFIAFSAEEAGLIGSEYFVKNPSFPLKQIKFLLNFDILGTGEDGLMVVNGDYFRNYYSLMDSINTDSKYVVSLQKRGKARNSDQYWFTEKGVPGFFIYTLGGVSYYHDIRDRPETLSLAAYSDIFRLVLDFVNRLKDF
ncbi:MAG: M28 family peptidase [Bacteroidia bacterium]|nr:M28 family peptidase [Bacteroidia bacterium]MCZ2277592.1 M28 family peptidase [Bacteroidia bacterium]